MFDDLLEGHFPHAHFQPFSEFSEFSAFGHESRHCGDRASFHDRFDAFMEDAFGPVAPLQHGEQCAEPSAESTQPLTTDNAVQAIEPAALPEVLKVPALDALDAAPPDTTAAQSALDDLVGSMTIKL